MTIGSKNNAVEIDYAKAHPIKVTLQDNGHYPIGIKVNGPRNMIAQLRGIYVNPYNYSSKFGVMPLTPASVYHIQKTLPNADIDSEVLYWLKTEKLYRRLLNEVCARPYVYDKLYPHQNQAVAYLEHTKLIPGNQGGMRALLADDPRLGKTIETITAVTNTADSYPIMVLCLKSLISYWKEQFIEWGESNLVVELTGSTAHKMDVLDKALAMNNPKLVVVTNWQFMRSIPKKKVLHYRKFFNTLIGDEAHIIKNVNSALHESVRKFRTRNLLLLTATPVEKGVQEYYAYLKLLRPAEFGSYWKFVTQFATLIQTHFGVQIGPARNKPLLRDFLFPIVLRRSAKETITVPDKIFKDIHVKMTPQFRHTYNQLVSEIILEIDGQILEIPNALARLTRLRQLSSFPAMLGYDQLEPYKTVALHDILKNSSMIEKAVVYVSYRDSIHHIYKYLSDRRISSLIYSGNPATIKNFAKDTQYKVLLTTPESGGVGLDLSFASTIVFYDIPWSSITYRQAIERTTKMGLREPRLIVTLLGSEVDHFMSHLMRQKLENITDSNIIENILKVLKFELDKTKNL